MGFDHFSKTKVPLNPRTNDGTQSIQSVSKSSGVNGYGGVYLPTWSNPRWDFLTLKTPASGQFEYNVLLNVQNGRNLPACFRIC